MAKKLTIPPTVAHRPKGLIDCAQMTDAFLRPGQDRQSLYDQTRGLVKANYLIPSAREERGKKVFLFTPDNMLIADALLRLRDFGVSGSPDQKADPYLAASLALRHWIDKPEGAKGTPAAHVMAEFEVDARGWVLEVWSFIHDRLGRIQFEGRIHNANRGEATPLRRPATGNWRARSCMAVDLSDAMEVWHPRAAELRDSLN
jgi:hypothetical protein